MSEMKREFPVIRINGREIQSTHDFCECVQKGPWDAKLKEKVAFATSTLWGDHNQWAINLEEEFAAMPRIREVLWQEGKTGAQGKMLRKHVR